MKRKIIKNRQYDKDYEWLQTIANTHCKPIEQNNSKDESSSSNKFYEVTCYCHGNDCKKKAKNGCVNKMCFTCCSIILRYTNDCSAHYNEYKKFSVQNNIIRDGLKKDGILKKSFVHYEERFTDFEQTVIVFSLKLFCSNKCSEDTMTQLLKQERQNELRKKREFAIISKSNSSSNSCNDTVNIISSNISKRKAISKCPLIDEPDINYNDFKAYKDRMLAYFKYKRYNK